MSQEISPIAVADRTLTAVEQNTLKRRGVGLRACDTERACPGYTLFAPCFEQNRTVYLIDLRGEVVHTWQMPYAPGLSGYLTGRGTLIYNGRSLEEGFLSRFPFKGGVILEADWSGKVLWEVHHRDHHHHGILLRNGNVLLNCLGQVPTGIAERVVGGVPDHSLPSALYGRQAQADVGHMYADYLAELTPSGQTVWEWRSWEHLDPVDDGIAEIQSVRTLWALGNSVLELADGDILVSYRPISTVIRIDRRTDEIVWKLGPPTLSGQHAPNPLPNGNVLIFDNGVHRLDDPLPFSRVIEVNPASNEIVWRYQDKPVSNFFTPRMGNAQRLPNGNTLINEASFGRFFEVTAQGETVWEYVNPHFGGPPNAHTNAIFRAYRYTPEEIATAKSVG
jgi:Arylsulfotransferase (ASST)